MEIYHYTPAADCAGSESAQTFCLLQCTWSANGRFCCRSGGRRKRPLAPSYRLSLPLAREWVGTTPTIANATCSRHACGRERRRSCHELGQPAEVLSDRCQRELELGSARSTQS